MPFGNLVFDNEPDNQKSKWQSLTEMVYCRLQRKQWIMIGLFLPMWLLVAVKKWKNKVFETLENERNGSETLLRRIIASDTGVGHVVCNCSIYSSRYDDEKSKHTSRFFQKSEKIIRGFSLVLYSYYKINFLSWITPSFQYFSILNCPN
jgi:hypothetical protein